MAARGSGMGEEAAKEEIAAEISRENYVRAVEMAKAARLSHREISDLQEKALWQMAALNRNAVGIKALADEYGVSPAEVKGLLVHQAQAKRSRGEDRELMPRYDYRTGGYLTFEEWLDRVLGSWNTF